MRRRSSKLPWESLYIQARQQTPGAAGAQMDAEISRLSQQIAQLEAQLNDLNTSITITRTG